MDLEKTRLRIRTIIFSVAGFISLIIFIGTTLEILGATQGFISEFFILLTNVFSSPFKGILQLGGLLESLHLDAVLVVGLYFFLAFVISEFVIGFFYESGSKIFANVIDGILKIFELFLLLRIVFDIIGVFANENLPSFARFTYAITEWASLLFLPITIGSFKINISAIFFLLIFLALDFFVERFLESIFKSTGNIVNTGAERDFGFNKIKEKLDKLFPFKREK